MVGGTKEEWLHLKVAVVWQCKPVFMPNATSHASSHASSHAELELDMGSVPWKHWRRLNTTATWRVQRSLSLACFSPRRGGDLRPVPFAIAARGTLISPIILRRRDILQPHGVQAEFIHDDPLMVVLHQLCLKCKSMSPNSQLLRPLLTSCHPRMHHNEPTQVGGRKSRPQMLWSWG